jgi:hypothetical protein
MDAVREWNQLFSNEALCRVYSPEDRHKRASGVPCIMNVIAHGDLIGCVRELRLSPSQLICHLRAIGWAGRVEFVSRLSEMYNRRKIESGG